VPYDAASYNMLAVSWPALGARPVTLGGTAVPFSEAVRTASVLAVSRTSAIAPVLRSMRSGLDGCDYFSAAGPYLAAARSAPLTGRSGAAGRHVTKNAFLAAIAAQLEAAYSAELGAAVSALAGDERYAAAIAREAVTLRERAHAAGIRSTVRAAVSRAVAACAARAAEFTCSAVTACGTGACRFAQGPYRTITTPAGPGRIARPANHVAAGTGFSEAQAAAELAGAWPWRSGVPVTDCAGRGAA
jgi:hypothetical protein